MVVIDGAYLLYPDRRNWSSPEQHEAVVYTCQAAGLGLTVHVPPGLWAGNEVEKRSAMFAHAEQVAEPNVDWYWVMDADEIVDHCPTDLRARLDATDLDVAEVTEFERHPETDQASWFDWEPESRFQIRKLFRAIPGLHVEGNHYTYATPDGRKLWDQAKPEDQEPCLDLSDLTIEHRTNYRTRNRTTKAKAYYQLRDKTGVEQAAAGGRAG